MNRQEQIEQLLVQWDQRRQQGELVDAEVLCADCLELADDIRPKIFALEQMYGLLDGDTSLGNETLDESPQDYWTEIPGYEYLDYLGSGGMGLVFKACENSLSRVVALKIIRDSQFASSQQLARFQSEAETVAQLKHPNIVQVYGVGRHRRQPFLSLEFVNGPSLSEKVDGRPQDPLASARVVETIARAVQFAHQRGIVHRDLKPANVLLQHEDQVPVEAKAETQRGLVTQSHPRQSTVDSWIGLIPKITDFGIAKRLDDDRKVTRTGEVIGTPSYMSPEQAAGQLDRIGPGTDIYGLGSILYEMLSGRPPFLAPTSVETLEHVRHREPVRLTQLQPGLSNDLENICLKCLEKDPARRYSTAEQLADDLNRFQNGQPVTARPVSRSEKMWRWCKRNPVVAALSFALAVVLIAGIAGITWKWREAEASDQRSTAALQKAREAIDEYFTLTSEETLLEQPGFQELRRELLQTALEYYQQLIDDYGQRAELNLDLAAAHAKVARVSFVVGSLDESREHYLTSIELHQKLLRQNGGESEIELSLAKARSELALANYRVGLDQAGDQELDLAIKAAEPLCDNTATQFEAEAILAGCYRLRGDVLTRAGQTDQAFEAYQNALSICQRVNQRLPNSAKNRYTRAQCYNGLGQLQNDLGQWDKAFESYSAATDLLNGLVSEHSNIQKYRYELSNSLDNLANLQHTRGFLKDALDSYIRSAGLAEELAEDNPRALDFQIQMAARYQNVGAAQFSLQQLDEAVDSFDRAQKGFEKILADNPSLRDVRARLANVHANISALEMTRGRPQSALESVETAVNLRRRLTREFPEIKAYQNGLSLALHNLASAQFELGDIDLAIKTQVEAATASEELKNEFKEFPDFQCTWATTHLLLAKLHLMRAETKKAIDAFERVIGDWDQYSANRPRTVKHRYRLITALHNLGRIQNEAGQYELAERSFSRATELAETLAGQLPDSSRFRRQLVNCLILHGNLQSTLKQVQPATKKFDRATDITNQLAQENPDLIDNIETRVGLHLNLGLHHSRNGDPELAQDHYQKAIKLANRLLADGDHVLSNVRMMASAKTNLGAVLHDERKFAQAVEMLNAAIELWKKLSQSYPDSFDCRLGMGASLHNLGSALTKQGAILRQRRKRTEAAKHFAEANDHLTAGLEQIDAILELEPDHFAAREFCFNILWNRARARNWAHDFDSAAEDWQAAFQLAPRSHHRLIRMENAWSLNKAGRHSEASKIAQELVKAEPEQAAAYFVAARLMGQAIKSAAADPALSATEIKQKKDEYFAQLMNWLEQAKARGYFAKVQNLRALNNNDFAAVRKIEAFDSFAKSLAD